MLCILHQVLSDQIKKNEADGACGTSHTGYRRGVYSILVGKAEGKRPLERPRLRWNGVLKWMFAWWALVNIQ
jgi:hypothetical protein